MVSVVQKKVRKASKLKIGHVDFSEIFTVLHADDFFRLLQKSSTPSESKVI
jgi:hypothetical protein